MREEKIIIPTKEEVKKMLEYAINSDIIHYETMGEILGMKWTDSLLPNVKLGPEWGYEGLQEFYKFYKINLTDTLKEALAKLK